MGVELRMPADHPLRTVEALRATVATGVDPRVIHAFYRAYWVEGRPPSDPATMRDVLTSTGHDADEILAAIATPEAREDLRRRTDEAIALGVFGAPAYVVDGTSLYWGQDRAELVAEALGAARISPQGDGAMGHTLEVYWDFSSPFAYLGTTQAEAVAARSTSRSSRSARRSASTRSTTCTGGLPTGACRSGSRRASP
jgi:2-hydroxychromene-2-carboxylate isomerase